MEVADEVTATSRHLDQPNPPIPDSRSRRFQMSKYLSRMFAVLLALAIMVAGTGVVLAAVSTATGKAQTQIKVVRENTTGASATSNSTVYADIPNATTSISVPSGTLALLVARFQGHGSVI